jgi:Ni,Fe-hydrogenase III large subunit/Ni,Fe-hydrogenase III component G
MEGGVRVGPSRHQIGISAAELPTRSADLLDAGLRLCLVAGHDDGDQFRVVYLFAGAVSLTELVLDVSRHRPEVPSLAGVSFTGGRFERELKDLFGIHPSGHPQPRALVRHRHWPTEWYPMRRDAGDPPEFGLVDTPFPFVPVDGDGVYEIPVGPVHAGLIEPGHFRFSVVGETIVRMKARLWYVHKGLERLFEGRPPQDGLPLAERISGDTAVGHTLAYCRAVEDVLGIQASAHTERIRRLLLELERVYNHVGDLGALCNDVGHSLLQAHALRIRETLLRLNQATTGHRLLRGGVSIGGATVRAVPDESLIRRVAADVREVADLALSNSLVAERFTGTAILSREQASQLGTLGYVARASGIDIDSRRWPSAGGDPLEPAIVQTTGDVLARFQQRVAEMSASFDTISRLLPTITAGSLAAAEPTVAPGGPALCRPPDLRPRSGVGLAEGWRGTIVHRVEIDDAGLISRTKVVDPSFHNWPALPLALGNTIVPDFPLANKSFNLSYAGNDL